MLLVNFQEILKCNNETFCLLFLFHNSPHLLRTQFHNEDQCSFCLSFYLQISLSVHLSKRKVCKGRLCNTSALVSSPPHQRNVHVLVTHRPLQSKLPFWMFTPNKNMCRQTHKSLSFSVTQLSPSTPAPVWPTPPSHLSALTKPTGTARAGKRPFSPAQ